MEKPALVQHPIHELLRQRWSPRSFSKRPVEAEKLFNLFEAARWSPSGGNLQPWAFVVTTQGSPEHAGFVEILSKNNQMWAGNAPVLVLVAVRRERQPGQPNPWALYDAGQAAAHLSIQAEAEGLSVHQMGGFDREKARDLFAIPDGFDPVTAVAIGYQGSLDDLAEELREREQQVRARKPLEEIVFDGHWDEPLK